MVISFNPVACRTTGPWPLPRRVLHIVRSSASLNFQYPLFSLRSYSSCLHFLPRLPVTSIIPSNFPSLTCFFKKKLLLRNVRPIQLSFLLFIVRMIFLFSQTPCNTSSCFTRPVQLSPTASCFKTCQVGAFLIYFSNCPSFNTTHSYAPNMALLLFPSLNFSPICW